MTRAHSSCLTESATMSAKVESCRKKRNTRKSRTTRKIFTALSPKIHKRSQIRILSMFATSWVTLVRRSRAFDPPDYSFKFRRLAAAFVYSC